MRKATRVLWIMLLFGFGAGSSQADVRYVTDQLKVTMRSGQSTTHKILRMLPSGMEVQLLEVDSETGYGRVRTPTGQEGWVLLNYLDREPSARERLSAATEKAERLEQANEDLKTQYESLQEQHTKLEQDFEALQMARLESQRELENIRRTAADAVSISEDRNLLRERVVALETQTAQLDQENRDLQSQTAQKWFLIGAGVIVIGILIGLIVPRLRFRRRTSWDSPL